MRGREGTVSTRRNFIRLALGGFVGAGSLVGSFGPAARRAWAAGRKVLARGTNQESLINENPADLDATNLQITPLEDFGTMGPTDIAVDLNGWRLEISGRVKHPLKLTYAQLTALPSLERNALLICPGFFANYGRWKGVSIKRILQEAGFDPAATRVSIEGAGQHVAGFALADVLSDTVFLAYQVNGQPLPRRNGSPLRVVAEDRYGSEWVKYVGKITVEGG